MRRLGLQGNIEKAGSGDTKPAFFASRTNYLRKYQMNVQRTTGLL